MGGKVMRNSYVVTMIIDSKDELNEAINKVESLTQKLDAVLPSIPTTSSSNEDESEEGGGDSLNRMVKHFEPEFDQLSANRLQNILEMDLPRPKALLSNQGYEVGQSAIAGGAVAVFVVFFIGVLLILLVVGVVKMRDDPVLRRDSRRDSMLEWDDNGLNVNLTMNPLEDVESNGNLRQMGMFTEDEAEGDDESGSEEDESAHEDELLTDDECNENIQIRSKIPPLDGNDRQGLEWDDSTLASDTTKSYHV